jgi:hypothetical protein
MSDNSEVFFQGDELKSPGDSGQEKIVKEQESKEESSAFDSDSEYLRIQAANKKGLSIIDGIINELWTRRFWTSVLINIALVGSALYSGSVFIVCVILTGIFHIIDKHTDLKIHSMHQKREYVKYGY